MNRRDTLLVLVSLATASTSLRSLAQQSRMIYRIGAPMIASRHTIEELLAAFEQGLHNKIERLPELYQEMVRSNVDIIITGVNPQTAAAKAATRTIPIVMAIGQEMGAGPTAKRLEYLKEASPRTSRLAVIFDPPFGDQDFSLRRAIEDAARPDALVWLGHARERSRRAEAVALTTKHRLPASYHDPAFVDAGGLMSYGPNVHDLFRRAGGYVSRILKGAKRADLPVEQPNKFELVINLRAARTLDPKIPQTLLLRADRVIE